MKCLSLKQSFSDKFYFLKPKARFLRSNFIYELEIFVPKTCFLRVWCFDSLMLYVGSSNRKDNPPSTRLNLNNWLRLLSYQGHIIWLIRVVMEPWLVLASNLKATRELDPSNYKRTHFCLCTILPNSENLLSDSVLIDLLL